MVMPVPTFAEAKVNTGLPPKITSSAPMMPDTVAVPLAVAAVVPSYTLLSPVNPTMVSSAAVMSAESVGWVNV